MSRVMWESYELGTSALRRRSGSGVIATTTGRDMNGTYCLDLGNSTVEYTNTGSDTDIYVGFFFRLNTPAAIDDSNTNSRILILYSSGGTELGSLRYNGITGLLAIYTSTGTLLATGTKALTTGATFHIQIRHKIDDASGEFELKVNDNVDATFSGDTKPGADTFVEYISFTSQGFGHSFFIDDVIFNNSLGSADNTYPGIYRYKLLTPTGVGAYVNNWSRNTGSTNWEQVDEVPHDSDTTYLYTTNASVYESFSMSDHGLTNATVRSVATLAVAKKDSGTSKLIIGIRDNDNSTDYMTPAVDLGVSYGLVSERRTTDPSSGAAWNLAGANATEALIVSSE